ncbi:WD40/YVTN/BNR-like repeat-containing protein [Rhodanobacter ginsengisoli]|uniref:WD40/YVTN/BNR-like repeat-containing protein n=1 Tax=Rhodanobacter ginsengisoli TaxID=418646 RepID=A0ABW0QKT0_9GAMM
MRLRRCLTVFALGLATTFAAHATVDPSLYQGLSWRLVGPFRGGRVLTVAGIPGDSRHFYFGSVDGGVWATADAGRTWQPIFDDGNVGSIGALALAPSDPKTIYVGSGEADMRSDIAHGNGMYKSTDAGAHWKHIGLEDSRQIASVLVDPRNPDVVFVAALGHAYGPNAERGVFRSTDGGAHWSKVLFKDNDTGAIDLAFKPGDPNTIYAALWQTRRPPWSVYPPSNGPGSGLYVSHDGGSHWSPVQGNGFPAHPGRIGIALAPSQPNRVYALVDAADGEGGLYRSDDGGAHWEHVTADQRIWKRGWYFCRLTVDPKNADRVYVMNTIVLRSDDGGKQFIALKGDPTGDDFHQMWIDPTNPDRQILGIDQGTVITLNGGKTWSSWLNQPTAQIYHVSTDNQFPYWVYGAQQDSGAVALPSRGQSHDGITMEQFHEVTAGGESGMIAPDPDDHDIVYGDKVDKLDTRTNQTRNIDPTLAYPAAHYRGAWTLPLTFSRRGTKTLYFANQRLFRTTDGGDHWAPISPDLTREDAGTPATLDPTTAADDNHVDQRRGVIYTIAPSPLNGHALWVGTDDGLVWRTDDDGTHWRQVTPNALTPWSKIAGIELSPFDANVAYLAVDRHRLDDDTPYIYRTGDGGSSWQRIDGGIPRDSFVNVVRADPQRKGLLYAGTERGMYVSFDDGARWQSLQQNLPMTSVRDIDIHGDDLVLATHGRGFWIMDDASALRQVAGVPAGAVTLFKPAEAIRVRTPSFTGTPLPKDEPTAANPPDGAIIDYALPAGVKGPLTLTVLDAQGHTVRSYSSADKPPMLDPARLAYAPEWVPQPLRLSTAAGMHRFVWDLHYTPPAGVESERGPAEGVWAPLGSYRIVLQVDGKTYRQPLQLSPDPRVKVSIAAMQREFALARQVEQAQLRAAAASTEADKLLKALDARLPQVRGALHAQIVALLTTAQDLSGVVLHPDPRNSMGSPPRRTDSLRALSMNLARLAQAVDGADADPGADARASYASLNGTLGATLDAWTQLKRQLNDKLKAAGGKPIAL